MPILGYGGMALGAGEGAGEAGRAGPLVLLFAVAAGLTFQVGRGLNQVVVKGAMNHRVPAELRATANSLSSLGVRVLFVGIGPAMGWGFDVRGYGPTFAWVTALFSLLLVLVALPLVLRIGAAAPDEETSRP